MNSAVRKKIEDFRIYFHEARNEIDEINLRQLKMACMTADMFLVVFILITPYAFPGWGLSWPYYVFCVMMLAVTAVSFLYGRKKQKNYAAVTALCLLYDVSLMTGCMLIDIIPYPNTMSTYFQIAIVFIAAMFIIPLQILILMLTSIEAAFLCFVFYWKTPYTATVDAYESIIGYICGILVAWIVVNLHAKEGIAKYQYMIQGTTDVLTQVNNRAECENQIRRFLYSKEARQKSFVLIMMDIDHFKEVNDKMGHQAGDRVLRNMGNALKEEFDGDCIIGRVGGDEFVVLLKGHHAAEDIMTMSNRVGKSMEKQPETKDEIAVSCSTGAVIAGGEMDYDSLYRLADEAMYEAKRSGGGKCVVHSIHS